MLPANRTVRDFPTLFDTSPFEEMNRLANWVFKNASTKEPSFGSVDVLERPEKYEVIVDLPGVSKENIDLSLEDNILTIKIERPKEEEEEANYLFRSRWSGTTTRSVTLPLASSTDEVEAKLNDGVLRITVAKQPEKRARKIAIN